MKSSMPSTTQSLPRFDITLDHLNEELLLEALPPPQVRRAVVMVGRLSPPTAGHHKVIDHMKKFMRERTELNLSAAVVVIVDGEKTGEDKSKNPLTPEERIKFLQASGKVNGVKFLIAPSAFHAFAAVRESGFEPIAVAAGSDRVEKYLELLDKYFLDENGEKIRHFAVDGLERKEIDSGEKKERLTLMDKTLQKLEAGSILDVSETSGSLARRAVELGYEDEFAAIVGLEHKPKLAKLMFSKIKKAMGESNGAS